MIFHLDRTYENPKVPKESYNRLETAEMLKVFFKTGPPWFEGGSSCGGSRGAPAEKFGLGQKF